MIKNIAQVYYSLVVIEKLFFSKTSKFEALIPTAESDRDGATKSNLVVGGGGGGRIKLSEIGGRTMVGSDPKESFWLKPSRMPKIHLPG